MEGILEMIFRNREEKVNDTPFKRVDLPEIIDAYEKYKHETKFWKLIRKAVYWYAVGTLTKEDCALIKATALSVDNIRLSDDTEDKILVMLISDYFRSTIERLGPKYSNEYLEDSLANIGSSESGNPKMIIASAIRSFTTYGVYLVDADVTKSVMPIVDEICGFTLEDELKWKR